ncbi:hypothetical protein DQW50_12705, partial [Halorubrum sp. 48-1-W]
VPRRRRDRRRRGRFGRSGGTSHAPANSLSTTSPIGVDDAGTEEVYSVDGTVDMLDDALGTEVDPVSVGCPVGRSAHDTTADASTFREATGWEPAIDFAEGVERVRAPSREADAHGTR